MRDANWIVTVVEIVSGGKGGGRQRLRQFLVVAADEEEAVDVLTEAPMRNVRREHVTWVDSAGGKVYALDAAEQP